jgi:hypothetical protein
MVVIELFEKPDHSITIAYNEFYTVTIHILNFHQAQLAEMKISPNSFLDQVAFHL